MKAYLINPKTSFFTEYTISGTLSLEDLYRLLDCSLVTTAAPQPNGDILYANDEISEGVQTAFFFDGYKIFGKALVVGTDDEGGLISPNYPIEYYKARVHWLGVKNYQPNMTFLTEDDVTIKWWDEFFKNNGLE